MAKEFSDLILELKKQIPKAIGVGSWAWSSINAQHRELIRQSISTQLNIDCPSESPPRHHDWSISISHCKSFGGWLAVPRPWQIGFDVEEIARINLKIIERSCTADEVKNAPRPQLLWCAKEACYKSLEDNQPQAISHIKIASWVQLDSAQFQFATDNNSSATGFCTTSEYLIFAYTLISKHSELELIT